MKIIPSPLKNSFFEYSPLAKERKEKKRIYSFLIMYKVFYILDGDLLNSALLV